MCFVFLWTPDAVLEAHRKPQEQSRSQDARNNEQQATQKDSKKLQQLYGRFLK